MGGNSDNHAKSNILGFWRETDELGFCSNWYPSGFEYRGIRFLTAEHWMMWQKACAMRDWDKADEILDAPTPRRAKELGGEVGPYDNSLWRDVREQLVYVGVREKFMQNPRIAHGLLATGSSVLAEASPKDPTWGVGLQADDPRFGDIAQWKGSNLLGRVCMRVRADLRIAGAMGVDLQDLAGYKDEMVFSLYRSQIGSMTLLELSRIPAARGAVLCYARLAQRYTSNYYPSVEAFLEQFGGGDIAGIDEVYRTNMGGGVSMAGWRELLSEIAFLHATGRV